MRRVVLAVLLANILAGCTTYYHHPSGKADFNRDKRECERIAEQAYSKNGTRVCDEIDRCLKSRGWVSR
jgi:hypothetical protein